MRVWVPDPPSTRKEKTTKSNSKHKQIRVEEDPTPFHIQAEVTMETKFFGTRDVCTQLFPLMRPQGRVVKLSSGVIFITIKECSLELQQKFRSKTITEEELVGLVNKFLEDTKNGVHQKEGPNSTYEISKIGVMVLHRIQARKLSEQRRGERIIVNACCPGWARTRMDGPLATKIPEEGAEAPLSLALLPPDAKGPHRQHVADKKLQHW
ncbi:LOW QUALITY PROTEIN: carbonyl reductase [NADPH] 1-like [Ctenodactylus gundi]